MKCVTKEKKIVSPRALSVPVLTIPTKATSTTQSENLLINFSLFHLNPICIRGEFNNHFKDEPHFHAIATSILGTMLPKITSHKFSEVCQGGIENDGIHFHSIDKSHQEIVRDILTEYGYQKPRIDQMLEGNDIFQFSATMGHTYAARVVCHKIDNILYLLFLDTNHHIYMNQKYTEESLFYESCPVYLNSKCRYMPTDCFAFDYLDMNKLEETYGYTSSP